MSNLTRAMMMGAAGASGDKVYVDDVFSTYLYEGTGIARSINNGIDLSGEGGLVWIKNRDNSGQDHVLNDTERGAGQTLRSDSTNGQFLSTARFSAFNSNGFSVGTDSGTNNNNESIASWTFRKQKGFFDVVTYTGNGTAGRTIAHNLGSVPGMIIVKKTNASGNWMVYHRSTGNAYGLYLNGTSNATNSAARWNSTTPTSTHFTVDNHSDVNANSDTYVAYIFAHDDAQFGTGGNESIIKCGSYTSNGSEQEINLGFEPQFVLIKTSSHAGGWYLFDSMRGIFTGSAEPSLQTQEANAEAADNNGNIALTATGFRTDYNGGGLNDSGKTYVYMAIRRPHKPPEVGTDVFALNLLSTPQNSWTPGFAPDSLLFKNVAGTPDWFWTSRLQGTKRVIYANETNAEVAHGTDYFHYDNPTNTIKQTYFQGGSQDFINYAFKRAPGFMDVVTYEGNGTTSNSITHNLGVTPELMFIKNRDNSTYGEWGTYYKTATAGGPTKYLVLNTTAAQISTGTPGHWRETEPTSTTFTLGSDWDVNGSYSYIAYLFATLPGISKVGSYTATGSALNIDCGFTSGARFVLIKRYDTSGNWFVLDTARGIVSGNDPLLELNTNSAQESSYDNLDPYNQGFTVTAYGGTSPYLNISGGTYLFFAIA